MHFQIIRRIAVGGKQLFFPGLQSKVCAFQLLDAFGKVGLVREDHLAELHGGQAQFPADRHDLGDLFCDLLFPFRLPDPVAGAAAFQLPEAGVHCLTVHGSYPFLSVVGFRNVKAPLLELIQIVGGVPTLGRRCRSRLSGRAGIL